MFLNSQLHVFYLLPLVLTNGFKRQPKDYWGFSPYIHDSQRSENGD